MRKLPRELVFLGSKKLGYQEYNDKKTGQGQIKVETVYSGISHGTEINLYRGTAPQLNKSISPEKLFTEGGDPFYKYPLCFGYEEIGRVIEVGSDVEDFKVGDIVSTAYGHRETKILDVDTTDYLNIVPPNMKMEQAIFQSLGSVALDSFLTSGVRLGENAVIFGQGIVGLLLLQICKLGGVQPIITVDPLENRLDFSKRLGADYVFNPARDNVAYEVRKLLKGGSDIVFETSGSSAALHEAIRCGAPAYSKVVAVGWYQGTADKLRLGEEFHHGFGAVEIISGGPWIHARLPPAHGRQWHLKRVVSTIFDLLKTGKIDTNGFITHKIPFAEAEKAYVLIDENPGEILKIVLTFHNRI